MNVALDEIVIKVEDKQYWLYTVFNSETNQIIHVRLYTARKTAITKIFLRGLDEKHDILDVEFLVDGTLWLQAGLFELGDYFRQETVGEHNPVEHIFE